MQRLDLEEPITITNNKNTNSTISEITVGDLKLESITCDCKMSPNESNNVKTIINDLNTSNNNLTLLQQSIDYSSSSSSSSSASSSASSSQSTHTTNSSSSTNSLAFTEEDDFDTCIQSMNNQNDLNNSNSHCVLKLEKLDLKVKPNCKNDLDNDYEDENSRIKSEKLNINTKNNAKTQSNFIINSNNTNSKVAKTKISPTNSLTQSSIRNNSSNTSSSSSSSSSSSTSSSSSSNCSTTNTNILVCTPLPFQQNNKYIFILNAFVNGFVQLKLCADKIDYEYIIEIYWSNEAKSFVKRTYEDFVLFHRKLIQTFSQYLNDLNKNKIVSRLSNQQQQSQQQQFKFQQSNKDSNSRRLFSSTKDDHVMPVLPASKKPFWISHLKLAESREIELNSYVQRLLKLPTKISHSPLVLEFFETQSSDPKPAKFRELRVNCHINNEIGSDSIEDDRDYDVDEDEDDDNDENNSNHNVNNDDIIDENDLNNNSDYDEDLEDDEDYDDYDNDDSNSNCDNSENCKRSSSRQNHSVGLNGTNTCTRNKKKANREAGLWWDEDEALNELTSSASFEFNRHSNQSHNFSSLNLNDNVNINYDEVDDELETLKTLETMLKNSDLFRSAPASSTSYFNNNDILNNDSKENISLSTTTLTTNNSNFKQTDNNIIKRLSLT